VEYPTKEELGRIVTLTEGFGVEKAQKMLTAQELIAIRSMIQQIPIADAVLDRALTIVMKTHEDNKYIREGASPRAAQYIVRTAKARAFMDGRLNVAFEDIEAVAPAVLRHRIILSFDAIQDNVSADDVIKNM
jgi:MoxR-like ATPase